MNNNNNFDISQMMNMLSKMDKKDLEAGIAKAKKILQTKSKEEILRDLQDNLKKIDDMQKLNSKLVKNNKVVW